MRKILALALSLLLVFAVIPMTMVSAEEADDYDYHTVLDADTYKGAIGGSTVAYADGVSQAYNVTITNEANPIASGLGTNAFKVNRTGNYDMSSMNYYDNANLANLAKNSIGFRVWVAAEPGNDKCITNKNILTLGFDSVTDGTHKIYAACGAWGSFYLGQLTTEGAWYTVMWDTSNMCTAKNVEVNNRFVNNENSAGLRVDAAFLENLKGLYVAFKDGGSLGSTYYVDDMQFIYPKGMGPTTEMSYEVEATMAEGASIRLDTVNGLRFTTSVDTDKVAELEAAGATVEYGTLIMPADLVSAEELTLETNVGGVTPIDVVYGADALVNGNQFRGSIVGVKETNIARDFVGRGYVKVTAEDGTETVSYANAQTRSLKEVAAAFASAGYPGVDDAEVKALVDTWANK